MHCIRIYCRFLHFTNYYYVASQKLHSSTLLFAILRALLLIHITAVQCFINKMNCVHNSIYIYDRCRIWHHFWIIINNLLKRPLQLTPFQTGFFISNKYHSFTYIKMNLAIFICICVLQAKFTEKLFLKLPI